MKVYFYLTLSKTDNILSIYYVYNMKKSFVTSGQKKILPIKVPNIVVDQFDAIQDAEGFVQRIEKFLSF